MKDSETYYVRRCHMCDHVMESHDKDHFEQCENCGKHFAPFFYFDDKLNPVSSDSTLKPPLLEGEYRPIEGLTVYWNSF